MLPPYRLREERTRRRDLRTARCGIVISTFLAGTIVAFAHPPTVAAQATCSSTEAIACGEVKAGSISTVGQTDCFEFSANAGEVVTLLAKAAGSTIQACAQLRDPSGNVVDGDACGQLITITIPATGAYTIRLFDRSHDQTGSYKLQLQVVSSTTSSCPVATLPCGSTPGGSLGSVVQSDTYRFSSTGPGEVVSITVADATAPFEACWQLYDGDGIALGTLECGEDTRTLPTAGPYTVRVFDLANDDTGTYRLDVTIVSATATSCRDATLACGAPHAGTISALADNDVYWFTTSFPNEVVGITTATTSGTMNACWQLYDFAGTSSGNIICGHDERVIATPGTYVLRVFDLTYDGAGTYDVSAMTQPACIATPTPTPTVTATATPSSGPTPGGVETATPSSNGSDATATPSGSGSPGSTPGGVPTSDGSATPTATGAGAATPTAAT
ncbi:MAG: hypothetical protein ABIR79_16840, partial [Candidatus Binatia bacterium]